MHMDPNRDLTLFSTIRAGFSMLELQEKFYCIPLQLLVFIVSRLSLVDPYPDDQNWFPITDIRAMVTILIRKRMIYDLIVSTTRNNTSRYCSSWLKYDVRIRHGLKITVSQGRKSLRFFNLLDNQISTIPEAEAKKVNQLTSWDILYVWTRII